MERNGFTTIMVMLTAVSVVAPMAEWMKPGSSAPAASVPSVGSQPRRSPEELREALSASERDDSTSAGGARESWHHFERSPFGAIPDLHTATAVEEPMPVVELLGIIESPNGSVATLVVDGAKVSLRVGESSGHVTLQAIGLPDSAVMAAGKRTETVRVR